MDNKIHKAVTKDLLNRVLAILADLPDPKVERYSVAGDGTITIETIDLRLGSYGDNISIRLTTTPKAAI